MDAAKQRLTQLNTQFQRFITWAWYTLRSPITTVVLLLMGVVIWGLGWVFPQQPLSGPPFTIDVWHADLALWLQPWDGLLFGLGFSKIFQTWWFWLLVTLLLLNSLIALADYTPGSWRRRGRINPPLAWQHPLARRVEHSVRLSTFPDNFMDTLRANLRKRGFTIYEPAQPAERLTAAAKHRRGWLGIIIFYGSLIVLIAALLLTRYSLRTEQVTLWPGQPYIATLLKGKFALAGGQADTNTAQILYTTPGDTTVQTLNWQRYRPAWLDNTFVLPVALEPVLTVEMREANDAAPRLTLRQDDLLPGEQLSVPWGSSNSQLVFTVPAKDLAVIMVPNPAGAVANVQVRRGVEEILLENAQLEPGQSLAIEDSVLQARLTHNLTFIIRRDWGLPLYGVALVLMMIGILLALLRPAVIWLVPEVKGIGGQFYGVMESFDRETGMTQLLQTLLVIEDTEIEEDST